ncbi:Hypothetical predicted protein [Octopus vulgaris]|uniref:Uncharacterized protein n=1 Tax=Octopus vulgaris TaxID=6645 RepID=A0AA36BQU4_OCTVU|nr:Hypothetical predicted protein [Octopus vulgaris]
MAQFQCSRNEIEFFGNACKEIGVQYIGLCCGNTSDYFRLLCETCGKTTKASRYTTDMSNHYLNTDKGLSEYNAKVRKALLGRSISVPYRCHNRFLYFECHHNVAPKYPYCLYK